MSEEVGVGGRDGGGWEGGSYFSHDLGVVVGVVHDVSLILKLEEARAEIFGILSTC